MAVAAVVFDVNKCDHKKNIEFYCACFGILAFRFQSHLRTQSDIPNTIPYAITHTLLHSHSHECSTLCSMYGNNAWHHTIRIMCVCERVRVECEFGIIFIIVWARTSLHRVLIRAHAAYTSRRRTQKKWKSYTSLWLLSFPHFYRWRHSVLWVWSLWVCARRLCVCLRVATDFWLSFRFQCIYGSMYAGGSIETEFTINNGYCAHFILSYCACVFWPLNA